MDGHSRTGKSTLAKKISERLQCPLFGGRAEKPKKFMTNGMYYLGAAFYEFNAVHGCNTAVCDRSFISDCMWAEVHGRLSFVPAGLVDSFLKTNDVVHICFLSSYKEYLKALMNSKDGFRYTPEQWDKIADSMLALNSRIGGLVVGGVNFEANEAKVMDYIESIA